MSCMQCYVCIYWWTDKLQLSQHVSNISKLCQVMKKWILYAEIFVINLCVCLYICVCVGVCVYMCVWVCVCVCVMNHEKFKKVQRMWKYKLRICQRLVTTIKYLYLDCLQHCWCCVCVCVLKLRKQTLQSLLVTLRGRVPRCTTDSYSRSLPCSFVQYSLWIFNYHRLYYSHKNSCG